MLLNSEGFEMFSLSVRIVVLLANDVVCRFFCYDILEMNLHDHNRIHWLPALLVCITNTLHQTCIFIHYALS